MARPKGSHDIASIIRGAFIRAAKMLEEDGKPLSTIIYEQLDEKPLDTLRAISQFVPKEMLIEADITSTLDAMSDEAIESEIRRLDDLAATLPAQAGAGEATQH